MEKSTLEEIAKRIYNSKFVIDVSFKDSFGPISSRLYFGKGEEILSSDERDFYSVIFPYVEESFSYNNPFGELSAQVYLDLEKGYKIEVFSKEGEMIYKFKGEIKELKPQDNFTSISGSEYHFKLPEDKEPLTLKGLLSYQN